MDETDRLGLLAELTDESCQLNHGPGTENQIIPACNYVVLPVGLREKKNVEICDSEMVIPVCQECAEALVGDEWTLLYCIACNKSQWVCRQLSRMSYRHHILWLKGCPKCGGFGGLYFNDDFNDRMDEELEQQTDQWDVKGGSK